MRNLFKNKVLEALLVILGTMFIFQYIIAPGLSVASSITNIIAMLASLFMVFALFKYFESIKGSGLKEKEFGETELDYIPKPKPKRSSSKKSEYPLESHAKAVKKISKTIKTK